MKRTSLEHLNCSVARSLDVIGEWWTLMIVRDVFQGKRRFEEIRQDLGISRNVLTDRLGTLVARGILHKVPVEKGFEEYRLPPKGVDLHSVIVTVMQWGDRWEAPDGPPLELVHECGHVTNVHLACGCCGGEVTAFNVTPKPGPGMKSRRRKAHT